MSNFQTNLQDHQVTLGDSLTPKAPTVQPLSTKQEDAEEDKLLKKVD